MREQYSVAFWTLIGSISDFCNPEHKELLPVWSSSNKVRVVQQVLYLQCSVTFCKELSAEISDVKVADITEIHICEVSPESITERGIYVARRVIKIGRCDLMEIYPNVVLYRAYVISKLKEAAKESKIRRGDILNCLLYTSDAADE